MKILKGPYLDLKVLVASMILSVIFSGESCFKLFVPHETTTFLTPLTKGRL